MKAFRATLVVVILFNLALLAAAVPLRSVLTRYRIARQQQELRSLQLERRTLYHQAALARRPDVVMARAAALGIDVRLVNCEALVSGPRPIPYAPRR